VTLLEHFIYEDHYGRRFNGLEQGVYLNYNDLRDYSWGYDTINSRISRFYQDITKRTIPLVICCGSDAEAIAAKNRLLELAEADIEARLPGKVRIGEYYTNGYITGSKKSNYLITKRYCTIELTLTSEDPAWYREHAHYFGVESSLTATTGGTDYPYDYPYDYAQRIAAKTISCDSVGDNAFRLTIYGSAINPAVIIGGHSYKINGAIGMGEKVTIDSLNKTITLTTVNGTKVNWFDKRGRDNYIFEPIPPGNHPVSYNGSFTFDLTIIEKRREPKWT
jgi:hypothetical protein